MSMTADSILRDMVECTYLCNVWVTSNAYARAVDTSQALLMLHNVPVYYAP